MGVIRKTLSVGTLGLVSFRSKKERLRRAERSQHHAEASLLEEQAARIAAEARITAAEKRVKQASADAAHAAKAHREPAHLGGLARPVHAFKSDEDAALFHVKQTL